MNTLTPGENTRHIYGLVELCSQFGIRNAVVCPGSRCAPLLIGFGKHPKIETISITDERSAGFVGLGLAQQSGEPVALVCTSGTAAQNFTPTVTEAYYQNVPLIVLTADRPPEWIDQWDGQTIHQKHLYEPHVKGSYVFDEKNQGAAEEALNLAMTDAHGPVHLNIPIREPFYPDNIEKVFFAAKTRSSQSDDNINKEILNNDIWQELHNEINLAKKILILGGQSRRNPELIKFLNHINIPVIGDVISNLHGVRNVIKSADLVFNTDNEKLKPDFLISFGRSVISKNLKLYLRKNKPKSHWHMGLGMVGDPFQSLTETVRIDPEYFFNNWLEREITSSNQKEYQSILFERQTKVDSLLKLKLNEANFNYFTAVWKVLEAIPENSILHLGNSMPVRIANIIGLNKSYVEVWSNRGTSGIDGTVSTAVGHALANPGRTHTLITGDLAFFYDRNGLWLNHEFPKNLRIVVLNDYGGGIFNMIPGPSNQGDLIELFTTSHNHTAELSAEEFGLGYRSVHSIDELESALLVFENGIMEIFTDMNTNKKIFNKIAAQPQG